MVLFSPYVKYKVDIYISCSFLVLPSMVLEPHCSSEKAFVWKTPADFADEEPKQETLAIKFGNVDSKQNVFLSFVPLFLFFI